ncbi:MAG: VOC family protein [Alphaproteobacteria bacterium]|nr:VOC family protein [Alphaproteobacteria bacterium]
MSRITPCLWIPVTPEEAVAYYKSIFANVEAEDLNPMTGFVTIEGQRFQLLNGGPHHQFNDSVSFVIKCKDQAEVDHYWDKLTAKGGAESHCAWCKDKYGMSWQVVPDALMTFIGHSDRTKADRAMQAMLKMKKIIVADLEKAFNG